MSTNATGDAAASEPQGTGEADTTSNTDSTETPSVEELTSKLDEVTKHSRKWEERAKANKEKADRLDELEQASLSDAQKAQKALDGATARAEEAEARAEAAEAALSRYKVAAEYGISVEDADLFLTGSDEETIKAQAKRFAERAGDSTGTQRPKPNDKQGNRGGAGPKSTKDVFADFLDSQLNS